MSEVLYDGKHEISIDEVMEKMIYFINFAKKGKELYDTDPKSSIDVAKSLRSELENEYKNNSLKRISDVYFDNNLFNCYRPAVHESIASITGKLTQKNVYSFLYDVDYYMSYYLPKRNK